jgi:hypothetical protein
MVGKEERARGRESGVGLRMGKRGRDNGGKRGMTRDEENRELTRRIYLSDRFYVRVEHGNFTSLLTLHHFSHP